MKVPSSRVEVSTLSGSVLFLRTLLADIGFPQDKPTKIYEDNKSCIHMLYGTGNHQRTKHINGKYHFSKQQIKQKTIKFKYKPTDKMIADILTKGSIPASQFEKLRSKLLNM